MAERIESPPSSSPEGPSVDPSADAGTVLETRLSPAVTALLGVILLTGIGLFAWLQISIPRLERVTLPEQSLALVVSRGLEIDEAIAHAPPWERWVYEFTGVSAADDIHDAIEWYRELTAVTLDPHAHLQLAILEGEAGQRERIRERIDGWRSFPEPFPAFAGMVHAAYLEPALDREVARSLQSRVADALPTGWFQARMAIQVAARSGDDALLASLGQERAVILAPLLQKIRLLTAVEGAVLVIGGAALLGMVRHRGPQAVSGAPLPPPWSGRRGATVLIRGGGLMVLLTIGLVFIEADHVFIRLVSLPVASLPLLALASRHLLAPHQVSAMAAFGLKPVPMAWRPLGLAVGALLAASLAGEWALAALAGGLGVSSHWTEWFDPDLVWGASDVVAVSLAEFVLMAPVLEEVAFRGLLFGTLRRRFAWNRAAVISAGIFAIAHGYGAVGLVTVFWSGLLWAWIYEKTGSLLPSMIAHAVNNLLVCTSMMILLRW